MDILRNVEAPQVKSEVPAFGPGDTVKIAVRVVEGDKVRSQIFQGVVVARAGSGTRATFTVRKISDGVTVERIFPLHSPNVAGIEIVRRGRVRRARLTYLRGRKGRSARIRERTSDMVAAAAAEGAAPAAEKAAPVEQTAETAPAEPKTPAKAKKGGKAKG